MQQVDDVSSYAREDRPRIHGVRSLMSYSSIQQTVFAILVKLMQTLAKCKPGFGNIAMCGCVNSALVIVHKWLWERITLISLLKTGTNFGEFKKIANLSARKKSANPRRIHCFVLYQSTCAEIGHTSRVAVKWCS